MCVRTCRFLCHRCRRLLYGCRLYGYDGVALGRDHVPEWRPREDGRRACGRCRPSGKHITPRKVVDQVPVSSAQVEEVLVRRKTVLEVSARASVVQWST